MIPVSSYGVLIAEVRRESEDMKLISSSRRAVVDTHPPRASWASDVSVQVTSLGVDHLLTANQDI